MLKQPLKKGKPFNFAVLTDTPIFDSKDHIFDNILEKAVAAVNKISPRPDFVLYACDLGNPVKKEEYIKGKQILGMLKVKYRIIPDEHDCYQDMGEVWRGLFGNEH